MNIVIFRSKSTQLKAEWQKTYEVVEKNCKMLPTSLSKKAHDHSKTIFHKFIKKTSCWKRIHTLYSQNEHKYLRM